MNYSLKTKRQSHSPIDEKTNGHYISYILNVNFDVIILVILSKCCIFVVNYNSSHGKFFEFDLVSDGKVVLRRRK